MIADEEWFTAGAALRWLWKRMFTRTGAAVLATIWVTTSWYFGSRAGGGFSGYVPYAIAFPFVLFISAIMLVICTLVGDASAGWVARVVLRGKLRPASFSHQTIYFVLSCLGLLVGAIIFGIGDPSSVPFIP